MHVYLTIKHMNIAERPGLQLASILMIQQIAKKSTKSPLVVTPGDEVALVRWSFSLPGKCCQIVLKLHRYPTELVCFHMVSEREGLECGTTCRPFFF